MEYFDKYPVIFFNTKRIIMNSSFNLVENKDGKTLTITSNSIKSHSIKEGFEIDPQIDEECIVQIHSFGSYNIFNCKVKEKRISGSTDKSVYQIITLDVLSVNDNKQLDELVLVLSTLMNLYGDKNFTMKDAQWFVNTFKKLDSEYFKSTPLETVIKNLFSEFQKAKANGELGKVMIDWCNDAKIAIDKIDKIKKPKKELTAQEKNDKIIEELKAQVKNMRFSH